MKFNELAVVDNVFGRLFPFRLWKLELGILYILNKLEYNEISAAELKMLLYITLLRWPPVTGELNLLISNNNPSNVL
jgi:hypothetical protein